MEEIKIKEITLTGLFAKHGRKRYWTDKGDGHTYLETYDELFKPFQHKEIDVFECGHSAGGGLRLFEDYFEKARIFGIDNRGDEDIKKWKTRFRSGRVTTIKYDLHILDDSFFLMYGIKPTIAIDDSTHTLADQVYFLEVMYDIVKPGGLIIIEDVAYPQERKKAFEGLGIPFELIDMNHRKNTLDNALIVCRKK